MKSLKDTVISKNFSNASAEYLSLVNLIAYNTAINSQFVGAINTAAKETLSRKSKTRFLQPWQDDVMLKELYHQRDLQKKSNVCSKLINTTTKRIRKRTRFLQDEYFKAEVAKIKLSYVEVLV